MAVSYIITIREYLNFYQPSVVSVLLKRSVLSSTRTVIEGIPEDDKEFRMYKKIMEERPKPGKAGILPEEQTHSRRNF